MLSARAREFASRLIARRKQRAAVEPFDADGLGLRSH